MLSRETFDVMYEGYEKYCKDIRGFHTCADAESIWLWEAWKEIVIDKWEQKLKSDKSSKKTDASGKSSA